MNSVNCNLSIPFFFTLFYNLDSILEFRFIGYFQWGRLLYLAFEWFLLHVNVLKGRLRMNARGWATKRQLQSPITPLPDPSPSPPTGSQEQAIFCRVMVGRTEVCTELQHISCCHLPDTQRTRIRERFSQSQSQNIRVRNQIFTKPIKPVHVFWPKLQCYM